MTQVSLVDAMHAATERHRAGRLAEAEAIYRQVLASDPGNCAAWHFLGVLAGQVGQSQTAVELLERAVTIDPARAEAWSDLGNALQTLGRFEAAAAAHRRGIQVEPGSAKAWNNLGVALHSKGQFGEAAAAYREALRLEPAYPAAQTNLGKALESAGQTEEAIAAQKAAVALAPQEPRYHFNLGCALAAGGRLEEAISEYRETLQLDPRHSRAYNNLGNALLDRGQSGEAMACYEAAIRVDPTYAAAFRNLGNALQSLGRADEAVAACAEALRLGPDDASTRNNLGVALQARGDLDEAILHYGEAVRLDTSYVEAWSNLGNGLRQAWRLDEATEACRRALHLDPNFAAAYVNLGGCLKDQGQLALALDCFQKATALQPSQANHGNLVYTLYFCPESDARSILAEALEWDRRYFEPLRKYSRLHGNGRTPDRRLRIGYVSPDFRDHVVGRNLLPLFREHDHECFEIFCYSNTPAPDWFTSQFRELADGWRTITGLTDDQAAELIRADQIDILVDLALHMAGSRLAVFARKPAPVQVTFAGYPGGTGLKEMDWRLTDSYLDPPAVTDGDYRERSFRLPHSFWCYDPVAMTHGLAEEPRIGPLPAATNGFVTLGCLSSFCKLNEPTLRLWAKAMRAIAGSRLILLAPEGTARSRMLEFFRAEEVEAGRVEFRALSRRTEYLKVYDCIDLGLDPLPYNGHTTSLDSLWMGVPFVTLAGRTAVGRAGVSHLNNLALPELIAVTEEQFLEIATTLAGDLERLKFLRSDLRERLKRSPLADAKRFTRDIEDAFREMWRDWCLTSAENANADG